MLISSSVGTAKKPLQRALVANSWSLNAAGPTCRRFCRGRQSGSGSVGVVAGAQALAARIGLFFPSPSNWLIQWHVKFNRQASSHLQSLVASKFQHNFQPRQHSQLATACPCVHYHQGSRWRTLSIWPGKITEWKIQSQKTKTMSSCLEIGNLFTTACICFLTSTN